MIPSAVLDASALVGFLLDPATRPGIDSLVQSEMTQLVIPHLCDVEVASGLRSAILRGDLDGNRAVEALEHYAALPLSRVAHLPLLPRVLAVRDNISAYDAAYVALAEALEAPLYTSDRRLARAATTWTDVHVVEV